MSVFLKLTSKDSNSRYIINADKIVYMSPITNISNLEIGTFLSLSNNVELYVSNKMDQILNQIEKP